jgi:hypothetical protein
MRMYKMCLLFCTPLTMIALDSDNGRGFQICEHLRGLSAQISDPLNCKTPRSGSETLYMYDVFDQIGKR